MSLDVYIETDGTFAIQPVGVPIRESGEIKIISRDEWYKRYPDREPIEIPAHATSVLYHANITHNLGKMAEVAGLYKPLWHPASIGITHAHQLIPVLGAGLAMLKSDKSYFSRYNPPNLWGNYDNLVQFVENYLEACRKYPDGRISSWT